jgi:serine protease Do
MRSWRRVLAGAVICGALVVGITGLGLLRVGSPARAQEQRQETRTDMQQTGRTPKPAASPSQIASVEDLATVFRDVGQTVGPSVVQVETRRTMRGGRGQWRGQVPPELFRRFFPDMPEMPEMPPGLDEEPDGSDNLPFVVGSGSGVVMEVDGSTAYIVTNNHVAGDAEELAITLADGRRIENATLVGSDAKTDVALIKVQADDLKPLKWGDSDELSRGDWVLAFGSPFGYVGSMTHGIISALKRSNVGILGAGGYEDFIQVDAPINPGNSGGPLVNIRGEVIGISTAIATRTGGFQGIGFAIPSNQARFVFQQLKEHGKVTRGWLGISIADLKSSPQMREVFQSFGYQGDQGVLVFQTYPGTPAHDKLQYGDIIVSVNGQKVAGTTELRNAVAAMAPGARATFGIYRDGATQEVTINVAQQPDDIDAALSGRGEPDGRRGGANGEGGVAPDAEALAGMQLDTLTPDLARRLNLRNAPESGAVVSRVNPRSAAARSGIRTGDVITEVGDTKVASAQEATAALSKADLTSGVRLYVTARDGTARFVFLRQRSAQ